MLFRFCHSCHWDVYCCWLSGAFHLVMLPVSLHYRLFASVVDAFLFSSHLLFSRHLSIFGWCLPFLFIISASATVAACCIWTIQVGMIECLTLFACLLLALLCELVSVFILLSPLLCVWGAFSVNLIFTTCFVNLLCIYCVKGEYFSGILGVCFVWTAWPYQCATRLCGN